jgi:RNA polymerase sigma-70 factor (ECF subfamily)
MSTTAQNPAGARIDADDADVSRVLGGDIAAFEGIVRRWQGPLLNMAWRYCRDRGRAEELAQEALVRAWRGLSSWRRESSFSTWLFALAANVYRNDLKRFPAVNLPIEDIAEPSRAADQQSRIEEKSRNEVVRRAVLALPRRYREPVVLFYFHEKNVAAAAQTMGLAEGTVKARLSRARELLRRRFPQLEKEHLDMAVASTEKGGLE